MLCTKQLCRCRPSNKGRHRRLIFLIAAHQSAQVPALAVIRVAIACIGSEIRRPVRNDILVDAYTIDPNGNYPDSLYQTSNEPFHSSKLMHRAGDGNGLCSVQLRHLVFMNGRFAPSAAIPASSVFGRFETCRPGETMSVPGGRSEVAGPLSK